MKRLFGLLLFILASHYAHAACTPLTVGMTAAQVQTAVNACSTAGGGTVAVPAGAYTWTSVITLPCNVSLSGPVLPYSQTHYQTAIINGSSSFAGLPLHTTAGCSNSQAISYLEWNGQRPLNGGGFIDVVPGTTNLVINNNYIHGANAAQYSENTNQAGVLLDGVTASPLTQNITITLNEFGAESYGDCGYPNGAMNEPNTEGGGGICAGVVSQGQTKNVSVDRNIFHFMEQGGKVVEATSNHGNTQNMSFSYNNIHDISRIGFESQSNITDASKPTSQNILYNFFGNRYSLGQFNFDISMANGCGICVGHMDYNAIIQDQPSRSGGQEVWGSAGTTGNYNLIEGKVASAIGGAITWSSSGQFNFNNNTFNITAGSDTNCLTASSGYWSKETGNNPQFNPTCTGNTFSNAGTGTYVSQTPAISPNGGSFTGVQTVTLTCPACNNRDANTSIWYTTDGTTPIAGTSKLYTAPFTVATTTIVKAIGMWGQVNQPYSYPAGYGYVPSALVSATFTAGNTSGAYFMSPTGNDTNPGTAASPWLTPNHAVNCGNTITAQAGAYNASNFYTGDWGPVTPSSCSGGNQTAWVTCATFDACKIAVTAGSNAAVWIDNSNWGMTGFEVTVSSSVANGSCFQAAPASGAAASIHHIIFANNVANGCALGGFKTFNLGAASIDYVAILGNVVYNSVAGTAACASAISMYQPKNWDTLTGTHIYIAGNFIYGNVDGTLCSGAPPTAGQGVSLDAFDSSGGGPGPYTQQVVVQNNISVFNGGNGFQVSSNKVGVSTAPIYFLFNTAFGNMTDINQTNNCSNRAELLASNVKTSTLDHNLAQTRTGTSCAAAPIYSLFVDTCDGTCAVTNNWLYSAAGNNSSIVNSAGFSLGTGNVLGTNPALTNTSLPAAPNCTGTTNAAQCAASIITGFEPSGSAQSYGYQNVSNTSITDTFFPQWLCTATGVLNPNIPTGLITPGCGGGVILTSITVSLNGVTTLATPNTLQLSANCGFSNGSNNDCTTSITSWVSNSPSNGTISASGLVTAVAAGSATFTAGIGSVTGTSPSLTITTGAVTLTGAALNTTPSANVNSIPVGSVAITMHTYCSYSNGDVLDCTATDAHGYHFLANSWTSSNTNVLTVGANTGVVTGVAVGTSNIQAKVTNGTNTATTSLWGFTVTQQTITLQSIQVATVNGITTFNTGQQGTVAATCVYTNGQAIDCTQPDVYGDQATIVSSNPGPGTFINNVFTATNRGSTTISASVGSILSNPNLLLTVIFNGPLTMQGLVAQGVTSR